MSPETLREMLRQQPFVPFRIHTTDGRTFDVRHPEMVLVMSRTVVVGIYDTQKNATFPERSETIALIHIVSLEPLGQAV
ncbi:MAG: hypothetical protein U0736_19755 [Gemmataceae bacterium]